MTVPSVHISGGTCRLIVVASLVVLACTAPLTNATSSRYGYQGNYVSAVFAYSQVLRQGARAWR